MNDSVLVTAIGSFSADAVIAALKKMGCRVIGCDIYPEMWHPCSKDLDAFFQVPFASEEEEYVRSLTDICRKEGVAFLVPLTDLEIDVLNRHRPIFIRNGICLCMQRAATLSVARDKYRLYTFFRDDPAVASIPTWHCPVKENITPAYPYIAKPCNGRSSEGLVRIEDDDMLRQYLCKPNYILQQCKKGPVFTVDYVRSEATGSDMAIPRKELLRTKNGAGVIVEMMHNPDLERIASHIGAAIGIHGCVNMEFIQEGDSYFLIDINPRFSAGIAFSALTGYDMVLSHMNCFRGGEIQPAIPIRRQIIAKRYSEEILWKE